MLGGGTRLEATRQPNREFGELADPTINGDRTAMLLCDDVVADRQTEAGTLTGRLRREERLEELVLDLGGNAGAVVADANLDGIAEIAGRHRQGRAEIRSAVFAPPFGRGIEPITDQVDEHAAHLLRHQFDLSEIAVVVAVEGNIEALILGTGTVVGKVQGFLDLGAVQQL